MPTRLRHYWSLTLVAVPLAFVAAIIRAPAPVLAPPGTPQPSPVVAHAAERPRRPATPTPTSIPPTATLAPTAAPTPSIDSTPTPRPQGTAPRVGLQVGHWKSNELPDELARLRTSSGAFAAGLGEAQVNLDITQRVAKLLEQRGIVVDVLPATVPVRYDADAFVAIHADGSTSASARGFKLATPWLTSRASQHLLDALTAEYAAATGLPQDDAITFNMRGYYAFSYRRHQHAVARTTPAVIVEMAYLTNPSDRAMLTKDPDRIAVGIANGIIRYLNERDPNDGAALLPPNLSPQRAISPDGLDVRAAPRDDARVLAHVTAEQRLIPFQERDGWYQVVVGGGWRIIGWVRTDQVQRTSGPLPTPPPAEDS